MHLLFIINPAAGANRASARWTAFQALLWKAGVKSDHALTTRPGEATDLARKAAANYDLLVAVGGDGTVTEVSEGILTAPLSRAILGILPLGTGNDLAEVLGIRTDAIALSAFTAGTTKSIDVLEVRCQANDRPTVRYALLFAGIGIISHALKKTTPGLKRICGKRLAYPAGLLRALTTYRSPEMTISCSGQVFQGKFLFAGASNTPIAGGGMMIAPGAAPDDGLLNVNLIKITGCCRALMLLRSLCRGRHLQHPCVRYFSTHCLEIDADDALEIAADGELIGKTPARIEVRPGALRVMVP
jgi:YegS/Rv2252/BmrU family lipid kinase